LGILDILIIIPLAWAAFQGYKKGLIYEIAKVVALLLGIFAAIKFSEPMKEWLSTVTSWDENWLPAIAFGLVFVGVVVGVYYFGRILDSMLKAMSLGLLNKLAGLALGSLKMGLILSGFLMLIQSVDKGEMLLTQERKESSMMYEPVLKFGTTVVPAVKESKLYKQVMENFNDIKEDVEI